MGKIPLIQIWRNKGKILEGIMNSIFTKEHVEEVAEQRMEICNTCPNLDKVGKSCVVPGTSPCCSLCGCSLKLKTRSLSSGCDAGKWDKVMEENEEDQIKQNLNIED